MRSISVAVQSSDASNARHRPLGRLRALGAGAFIVFGLLPFVAGQPAALAAGPGPTSEPAAGPAAAEPAAASGVAGTITAWGTNTYHQADVPAGLVNVKAVAGGYSHSIALKTNGTVVGWGSDSLHQTDVPATLNGVVAIAAGDEHNLALKSNGTVVAWGWDLYGQSDVPASVTGVTAIAAGYEHSLVLKANGTVVAWGSNFFHQLDIPAGLNGVAAISAGDNHSLALRSTGAVVAWGSNGDGEGNVPLGAQSGIVAIAAGGHHSLALKANGAVVAWGDNSYGQATVPAAALSGVVAITAGDFDSFALKSNGTVVGWGADLSGITITVPAGLAGVTAIAAGGGHCLALLPAVGSGQIAGWGLNDDHQADAPSSLTGVKAIDAGEYHSIALRANGTVAAWGFDNVHETDVPAGLTGVKAIDAGGDHNLALKADGTVTAWGYDFLHQTDVPAGLNNIVAVAAGYDFSLALRSNGTVVGWGADNYGQTDVPLGLTGVVAISAGFNDGLALKADGTVVGWGENYNHIMDVPAGLSGVKAISAGQEFDVALKADGTVVAWGWDTYGQIDVPAGLSSVAAVSSGGAFSLALLANGGIHAWGIDDHGQLGVPMGLAAVTAVAAGGAHALALVPPATVFTVSGLASPRVAGVAGSLTVRARTVSGGTATGYRGTVHFTSTDPHATLPANYKFTSADGGSHTFSVTLKSAGTVSVTATDTAVSSIKGSQTGIVVTYAAATYHAIAPARVLDTRPTAGVVTNIGLTGPFVAAGVRTFGVANVHYVGGGSAVAVPAAATAVTGNLTIVGETASGLIALGPVMTPTGAVTTLNFVKGDIRANNVTVGLGLGGTLSAVFRSATAGASVHVIFDVTGYFTPDTTGATYHTVAPGRVLDSRPTTSGHTNIGLAGKFASKTVRTFNVAGVTGLGWSSALVPAAATAVTGNLTVTNATSKGYVAVGPTMVGVPTTSTLNVAAGSNRANGVTVALHAGKLAAVWVGTTGSTTDVIFDVTGFFTSGAGGLKYYPIAPVRLVDTSTNLGLSGAFSSKVSRAFGVGGKGGIPAAAAGISGNLTLIAPSSKGYAFISPQLLAFPTSSTLNAEAHVNCANGFDVALTSGKLTLIWVGTTGSTADLQLDVTGYWK